MTDQPYPPDAAVAPTPDLVPGVEVVALADIPEGPPSDVQEDDVEEVAS